MLPTPTSPRCRRLAVALFALATALARHLGGLCPGHGGRRYRPAGRTVVLHRGAHAHGVTVTVWPKVGQASRLFERIRRHEPLLGPVLTGLPVGPSYPGRTAGPTFDIARPPSPCCHTRTRPGRSSRNGSTRWSRPVLPRQPGGPRRARPTCRQAARDEPGHRDTQPQISRLTALSRQPAKHDG